MPNGKKFASSQVGNVKRKACDSCKTRKVRCNGLIPCDSCERHGTSCHYTLSHGRIAHLESRIASLEQQLRQYEVAWSIHLPHTSIAATSHRLQRDELDNRISNKSVAASPSLIDNAEHVRGAILPVQVTNDALVDTLEKDSEPSHTSYDVHEVEQGNAEELDWDESLDLTSIADGIGSLALSSKGIGYMGPQSGNALLRNLQSVSILYLGPHDDNGSPPLLTTVSESVLKSTSFGNQCIDWYFQYYHPAYPILHEGYFRAQLMGVIPKPKDGSWLVLLHTIQAIGAHSGPLCNQNADIYFCQQASRFLSWDLLQRGTVSIVQALTLLANYLQKRNRPNTGFTLLGAAMTMAQGLGLHRELSGPSMSVFTSEIRRRVWWTLFIFDAGARVTFGRPTMSLGGINVQEPKNIDDSDLTVDLEELPPSRVGPTVVSSLIWQLKLAKISILANEQLLEKRVPNSSSVDEIDQRILDWAASLPDFMREEYDYVNIDAHLDYESFTVPRMVLLWRSLHLRIVILRPFLLDLVKQRKPLLFVDDNFRGQSPAGRCLMVAEACITSILNFWNSSLSRHGSFIWYACYWLVTAIFVHVTCLLYDPQNASAMDWRRSIDNAKIVFEAMGVYEPTAYRAAQLLQKVMDLVPTSPDADFFNLNEPIRMEIAEFWDQTWTDVALPHDHPNLDYV